MVYFRILWENHLFKKYISLEIYISLERNLDRPRSFGIVENISERLQRFFFFFFYPRIETKILISR